MEKPDQLRELWQMQQALNERIGVNMEGMSDEDKTRWILNYTRAMTQEIAELNDSVPWTPASVHVARYAPATRRLPGASTQPG